MSVLKCRVKSIRVHLKLAHVNDEPDTYRGSAWTCSVDDEDVIIYLNGNEFKHYDFQDVDGVYEG